MDTEREIYRLAARTMALEVIFKNLLRDLAQTEPYWRVRLASALDSSADQLEGATIKLGKSAHPDHLAEALRTCEEFRAVVLSERH
jgi:hypothetical protein